MDIYISCSIDINEWNDYSFFDKINILILGYIV